MPRLPAGLSALLISFAITTISSAQVTPHVTGRVIIRMQDGFISSDLTISGLPPLDTNYRVLLNRGMNLGLFRDTSGVLSYADETKGDYLAYRPKKGKDLLALPSTLRVSYAGAFPIYKDTLNWFDYKGWIAVNGKTLRAADQAKWYPVIYDSKNDRELVTVSYDLDIECADCKMIYVTGSDAKPGPLARLSSTVPRDLLLFAGDYAVQHFTGEDFINADMPSETASVFDRQVQQIRTYLEKMLGFDYKQRITFLEHRPVKYYGPNQSWGFVSFPTIAVGGSHFRDDINTGARKFIDMSTFKFYAHELSHYYFGNMIHPNSTLKLFFVESMAEYLSLKACGQFYGKDSVDSYLQYLKPQLAKISMTPLDQVTENGQLDEINRYYYYPVVLMALEKIVGEKKMFAFLHEALKSEGQQTDFAFFQAKAIASGITAAEWGRFSNQVLGLKMGVGVFDYLGVK